MPKNKLKWVYSRTTKVYFVPNNYIKWQIIKRKDKMFWLTTGFDRYYGTCRGKFKYLKSAKDCAELIEFG